MPRQVIDLAPPSYQFNDAPLVSEGIWRAAQSIANAPAQMAQIRMQQEDRAAEQQMRQLRMHGMEADQQYEAQVRPLQVRGLTAETNAREQDLPVESASRKADLSHKVVMQPLAERTAKLSTESLAQTAPAMTAAKVAKAGQEVMNIPVENRGLEAKTKKEEFEAEHAPKAAAAHEQYLKDAGQARSAGKQLKPKLPVSEALKNYMIPGTNIVDIKRFPKLTSPQLAQQQALQDSEAAGYYDSAADGAAPAAVAAPAGGMNVPGTAGAAIPNAGAPAQSGASAPQGFDQEVAYHRQQLAGLDDAGQQNWLRQLKREKPDVFQALLATETANARPTR